MHDLKSTESLEAIVDIIVSSPHKYFLSQQRTQALLAK